MQNKPRRGFIIVGLKKFAIEYDEKYLFEFFNSIDESQIIINPLRGLRY